MILNEAESAAVLAEADALSVALHDAVNAYLETNPMKGTPILYGIGAVLMSSLVEIINGASGTTEERIAAMDQLLSHIRRGVLEKIGARP